MKRCSTLLVIRELQTETAVRYYFTPTTRIAIIKKTWCFCGVLSVGKDVEKLEP